MLPGSGTVPVALPYTESPGAGTAGFAYVMVSVQVSVFAEPCLVYFTC